MQRAKKKMRFNLLPAQVCLLFSLLLTSCRERFLRGNTVNRPLLQFRYTKNTLIVCPCFAGLGELLSNLLNHIMDSLRSCYSFYSRKFFFLNIIFYNCSLGFTYTSVHCIWYCRLNLTINSRIAEQ